MPFTLSHTAAAYPLKRVFGRFAIASALAIGSVTPDVPYFLPVNWTDRGFAHEPLALLWFCLPAGLALWWLARAVLARPLLALAPDWIQRRLAPALDGSRHVGLAAAAFSVFLGAGSHLAWDSFTHAGSPLVEAIPLLRVEVLRIGGDGLYVYRLIQHVSTVVGLALVGWWSWRWLRSARPSRAPVAPPWPGSARLAAVAALLAIPALFAIVAALEAVGVPDSYLQFRQAVGTAAVATIRGGAVAVVGWAALWHARQRIAGERYASDDSASRG